MGTFEGTFNANGLGSALIFSGVTAGDQFGMAQKFIFKDLRLEQW